MSFKKMEFEDFEVEEISNNFKIGKNLILPFGMIVEQYTEYSEVTRNISEEEGKRIASDKAYKSALSNVSESAQIVGTDVAFERTDRGGTRARVLIECVEDIGVEQVIKNWGE